MTVDKEYNTSMKSLNDKKENWENTHSHEHRHPLANFT